MEQSPSWQGLPPDSAEYSALLIFFVSLVCVCVALFGEQVPAVYLGVSAVCTLTLALCLRLVRSFRCGPGFSLDDEARMLRPHGGRPLPFSSITALRLVLYRDRACLQVNTGALRRRRALVCVSRTGPAQDIMHALAERGFTVRVSKNPLKKRTAEVVPLLIMPLLAAALLYVSIDMYRRFPVLAQPPQMLSVEPAPPDRALQEMYPLGPIVLRLPRTYRLVDKQPDSLIFYSPAGDIRLALNAGPDHQTIPHSRFLQAVADMLGFGSIHDATLLALRSRFGLMPAMIKSALLKRYDPDTVQIYRVLSGTLSGVILRGEQARPGETGLEHMPDQVAEITLRTAENDEVIRLLIASRAPLDTARVKSLISGIRPQAQ